ncbi:unnamed protein product [Amoebophrya sp. A25]|nr:unnamed protein product [Amoebophrya sp. A25]|eukprot:GSA25T00008150001.1
MSNMSGLLLASRRNLLLTAFSLSLFLFIGMLFPMVQGVSRQKEKEVIGNWYGPETAFAEMSMPLSDIKQKRQVARAIVSEAVADFSSWTGLPSFRKQGLTEGGKKLNAKVTDELKTIICCAILKAAVTQWKTLNSGPSPPGQLTETMLHDIFVSLGAPDNASMFEDGLPFSVLAEPIKAELLEVLMANGFSAVLAAATATHANYDKWKLDLCRVMPRATDRERKMFFDKGISSAIDSVTYGKCPSA